MIEIAGGARLFRPHMVTLRLTLVIAAYRLYRRSAARTLSFRNCKASGWIELLGCGMVDPNVYGFVDYDPARVSGFAFGMGVERIAILKYGVDDIQLFFNGDVRFLEQFG